MLHFLHQAIFGCLLLLIWVLPHRQNPGNESVRPLCVADTTGPDLDARQARQFIGENPDVVVLDVRTPQEYAAGRIGKATNINLYDAAFREKLAALDRSKTYVVHCAAGLPGGRSRKVIALMDSLGFTRIRHLNGGFSGWQQAGLPIQKIN